MPEENTPIVIETVTKRIARKTTIKACLWVFVIMLVICASVAASCYFIISKHQRNLTLVSDSYRKLEVVSRDLEKKVTIYERDGSGNHEFRIKSIENYITTRYTAVPDELANIIAIKVVELSDNHNVPTQLVVGVMEVESNFNPFAVSNKKARGLMQVRPEVWADELKMNHEKDLHNIGYGIEAGILVLKHYIKLSKGDVSEALQRYNGAAGGTSYSEKVYEAVGRFTVFRENKRKESDNEGNSSPEENQATGSQN